MDSDNAVKKILILAANPINTNRLRLDKEVREIKEVLQIAKQRNFFDVYADLAATPDDIQQALLDYAPHVVHFCGHGEGSEGLILEGDDGNAKRVTTVALANLFELFADQIECVLLNACYSDEQAIAIVQHIDAVIGMKQAIGDAAAVKFAVGFYRGLGAGKDVEFSYKLGCNAIEMAGFKGENIPILKQKRYSHQSHESAISQTDTSIYKNNTSANIFISYRCQDPDQALAQTFHDTLKKSGYRVFMATESIRLGDNWPQKIDNALESADYFLLLLSPKSITSEMVLDEVRKAKRLREKRPDFRPVILPIRVNFPLSDPLNYDLRNYLHLIQQREWASEEDTEILLKEVLSLILEKRQNDDPQNIVVQEQLSTTFVVETPKTPPLPVAEPELPGGQVDLASVFYLERCPIEERCYEAIIKPGALIRIKAPRQMGKTSLLARILRHAEINECVKVPLSFQIADGVIFNDLDRFLRWFCASIGRRLQLPNKLHEYWDDIFGSKDNCTAYFEDYLLSKLDKPLALGLDEVDLVFQHPEIASDFFGMLRAWHENGKSRKIWKNLRLIVVHSTEVYIPLNINQSPFNVGLAIELPEFTPPQVEELAKRHGLKWNFGQLFPLQSMIGGHPYLVRVALYNLARQDMALNELLATAPTEAGPYGDHLRRHLWNLEQHPDLAAALKLSVASTTPVRLNSLQAFQLHSMGLVNLQGNDVTPRCDLYRKYFCDRLNVY